MASLTRGLIARWAQLGPRFLPFADASSADLPLPLAKGPFYAITLLGHSATSSTGVVVDGQMRVLRGNGQPVPNLYATGEVLGSGATLGNAFVPGMMLTPALAIGRMLGMTLPIGA